MATNLTNDPVPFTSRPQGDTAGWDGPLDDWVTKVSADVTAVRDTADAAASAAAAAAGNTVAASRIADGSLPLTKFAVDVATQDELNVEKARIDTALAAAGAVPAAPRVLTASGALLTTDQNNTVEMRNTAPATVTVPLTYSAQTANATPVPAGAFTGVERYNSDVTVAPAASNTTLHRLISESGYRLRAVGSAASVKTIRRTAGTRPTGFWAVLSAAQFDNTAHGTVIQSVAADAASSMTLPAITPVGAQRPTVFRNATNGRTGMLFNGSSNTLPLSGAWLDLFRLRSNAMILATILVPGSGITGDRAVVSFSVNGSAAPRVLMKWRDNGIAGPVVGGRRTDSTSETSAYCSTTGLYSPDLEVFGARYVWSSSDVYALRNNTQIASNLAFQTDGTTPDTASTTGCFGSASTADSQFFPGIILEIAVGPDDATLRASYQAWAELYYGEEALLTGSTVT